MPGLARTTSFQFSTATVLVGPQSLGFGLNSQDHALGLVKNVQFAQDTSFVELTEGITNVVVESMINKQSVKMSAEIFEMTARNIAYGLGLDGTNSADYMPQSTVYALAAAVAAAATTFTIPSDVSTIFTAGTWGYLQAGYDDVVHFFKTASVAYAAPDSTVTMVQPLAASSPGFTTANGRAGLLNKIDADPTAMNQTFGVQIIGVDAVTKRPVGIHIPKAKITKGFAMNFTAQNFGNLPFEFEPFMPVPTDPGYSTDFTELFTVFTPN